MKRKRHGTDEIIRKLREAEQLEATGQSAAQVCQKLEISGATLSRWRNQFRGMGDNEVRRMRALEEENRRLKRAVADLTLDKQILKELNEGKW
jgi:putative transposase